MPKFRKKPVEIEAIRFQEDGSNIEQIREFFGSYTGFYMIPDGLVIRTLEGNHIANLGDWIIKGVKGEFYPCKPDIFELTYEQIEE